MTKNSNFEIGLSALNSYCCSKDESEANMHDDNELEEEAVKEISDLLITLRKDSNSIIQQKDVYVLGHALSIVDDPYSRKIRKLFLLHKIG